MISHFIEASNGMNYGKFLLLRFDENEADTSTAMPEAREELVASGAEKGASVNFLTEDEQRLLLPSIWTYGGARKLNPTMTFVVDLQTAEGAAFSLRPWGGDDPESAARCAHQDLEKHKIWVCPMYEFFLAWLYTQGLGGGAGDITKLPRYVELETDHFEFAGHRREGEG